MKNTKPVDRSQVAGAFKAEIFVGKTERGWRWDVTIWRLVKGNGMLGVEGRTHVGGAGVGYARTERGAWRAARKAYNAFPEVII